MKNENPKEPLPDDFMNEQINRNKDAIELSNKIIHELTTKKKYKKYFEQYNPESVKHFIRSYAFYKSNLYAIGPTYKYLDESHKSIFKDKAKEYLHLIQQEKLVRLQFEWNKETMKLEGIECNPDFYYYYEFPFECPFLPPITKDEIDDLYFFLMSDEFYSHEFNSDQRYSSLFEETFRQFEDVYVFDDDDQNEGLPKYHYFLMEKYRLKPLLSDSLIRAKKENIYINMGREELRNFYMKQGEEMKKNPRKDYDYRPQLRIYNHEILRKFIAAFEKPEILKYYDVMYRERKKGDDGATNSAIHYLEKVKEQVTVIANDNWRTGIIEAAEKNKREKAARALYEVFDTYQKHIETKKTPFIKKENPGQTLSKSKVYHRRNLLRGRELAGEPRDFNF